MAEASSGALDARSVTRDIFSASLGSVACCYTGQPFDTVKVRMQTSPSSYPGVSYTARSILSREGVAAFWKGAVPTSVGMIAENAMAFGVNEALKRAFPAPAEGRPGGGDVSNKRPDLVRPFLMGAITGCCSATVLLPSEIVKAKTQVLVGSASSSSSDVYRQMIKRHGVRSLFVGFDAQIMRDMPFYAFFFGTYELNCYLFRTYVPSMPEELNYFMR
jgi:solute carrier family 25 ornithine transporter 2/15